MAETIGALQLNVEINKIDPDAVLKEIADELKEVTEAGEDASKAIDDATKEVKKDVEKVEEAVENADKDISKVSDTLNDVAKETSKTVDVIDTVTSAIDETTKHAETAASAMTEIADATSENVNQAADWTQELYNLTIQLLQLIEKGEEQSEQYEVIEKKIEDILSANQELASNPPFTAEQNAVLQEYREQLEQLDDKLNNAKDTTDAAADAVNSVAETVAEAADATEEMSETTEKNAKDTKKSGTVWDWFAKLLGVKVPAGATAAKFAMEALKMALSAGILTVITMLSEAIMKLIDKLTFGFRMQGELNSQVASSTAGAIASLKNLQNQWNQLGDDIQAKEKFINDNRAAFEELGVAVNSVNDAEKLLVSRTNSFITSIMSRARAAAAQELLQERMKDSLEDLAEAQEKEAKANAAAKKIEGEIANYKHYNADPNDLRLDFLKQRLAVVRSEESIAKKEYDKIMSEIENDTKGLVNVISKSNADAEKAYAELGLSESAELKTFRDNLKDRETAYKLYAAAIKSTDAEVRRSAADNYKITAEGGKTYLEFLTRQREQVRNDANKLAIVNEEIAKLTQPTKKTETETTQDELTYYEKLKLALQEVNAERAKGFKPDPKIIENLNKQIELYEKQNGLFDYSDKIAKYREFAEKLVEIENQRQEQLSAGQDETEVNKFADFDIEMLKQEYGITGDEIGNAIMQGLTDSMRAGEEDLKNRILSLKNELQILANQGNTVDNSQQIATKTALLKQATDAYNKLKNAALGAGEQVEETDEDLREASFSRLKKGIAECAQAFKNVGQQIGGTAGESLEFIGNLTDNVMSTISAIQTYATMTAETIKGVGTATAVAIRTVETASVILAIISAAMQIAMQLVELFQKDKETYEDKKNVYEGYISVLDTIIDREKELAETLTAQQAAAQYDVIGENLKKQEKSTRRIAQEYLQQGTKGKNNNRGHTVGYEMADKLNNEDWAEFQRALGGDVYKQVQGTRLMGLFELSGEQLKKLQEQASGFYSKLDSETRGYIEDIIRYSDNAVNLEKEKWETINGISFDGFKDNFVDALKDIDASAETITGNIKEYMRESLIDNMFKKNYAKDLEKYYDMWGKAMENDGKIDDNEWIELNALADSIAQGATAAANAINERFKNTADEIQEEEGLSGAIKNASQESIDLLAGQTNAVRMNQVEAMQIAREQLSAVFEINTNVALCAQYLQSINSNITSSNTDLRAQGIM